MNLSFASVIVWILAVGCAGGGGSSDASDGEPVGDADADAGQDEVSVPADIDLEGGFGMWIPAQTRACSLGGLLEDQLRLKSRIAFRPGLVVLPRDQDHFAADLIEEVELTPGTGAAVPDGPGQFARSISGTPQDGTFEYLYQQSFSVGARTLLLSLQAAFDVAGGQATAPLVVYDSPGILDQVSRSRNWLRIGFADGEAFEVFFSCDGGPYRINEYEFTLSNGARLLLAEWMVEVPGQMTSCAAGFTRATYTLGSTNQVVEDFWRLAYQPGNHNIIENFAFRFDPPLGDLHGMKVLTQSLGMPLAQLTSVFTLDENLAVSGELTVSEAAYRGVPCSMGQ